MVWTHQRDDVLCKVIGGRAIAGCKGFGSTVQKFSHSIPGTCYAVRADGKPLPHQHVDAICSFIESRVEPQLQTAIEGLSAGDHVVQRKAILASISKAEFSEFYTKLKQMKVKRGVSSWDDLPNPYEIKHSSLDERIATIWQAQQVPDQRSKKQSRLMRRVAIVWDSLGGPKK
jgi:hypothetical protein